MIGVVMNRLVDMGLKWSQEIHIQLDGSVIRIHEQCYSALLVDVTKLLLVPVNDRWMDGNCQTKSGNQSHHEIPLMKYM